MSLEPAIDPTAAVPVPGFNPFAAMLGLHKANNALAQAFIDAAHQMTQAMTVPFEINAAIEAAKAAERRPTRTDWSNKAGDFGITAINIQGKQWAVETNFEQISDTCVMWKFSCEANKKATPIAGVAPDSGGNASGMKYITRALLPYRDVCFLGWVDPRELHENTNLTIDRQGQDVSQYFIRLGRDYPRGYDALGISQSGFAVTEAVARMEREGKHLDCLPRNIILAGSPMDISVGRTPLDIWLHNLPRHVQEKMLINIGDTPKGRKIFSANVLTALLKNVRAGITHPFEEKDMDGGYWLDVMDVVFRRNSLASRRFAYKGGLLTIAVADDIFVPGIQTKKAYEQFPNVSSDRRRHHTVKEGGHFGPIQPGKAMDEVVAVIDAFTGPHLQLT